MSEDTAANGGPHALHVVAVCCGQGFPNGMAISYRLKMAGLGLLEQGARVSLFHVGGSPFPNDAASGDWRGIRYRYIPPVTGRQPSAWRRRMANAGGLLGAMVAIRRLRRGGGRVVVYSAGFYSWENRVLAAAGAPVVLDLSEWYEAWERRDPRRRLAGARGVVAISRGIESRVQRAAGGPGRSVPVLRVPILMDAATDAQAGPGPAFSPPYLLWTGSPHGEIWEHLAFLVRVAVRVRRSRPECRLVLMGEFRHDQKAALAEMARSGSGEDVWLTVHGFVPKDQIAAPIAGAAALLAPLPTGVRWECCFPTKLGEYLASGRPVVSSRVGEVAAYLTDGETAMVAEPGDVAGWCDRIVRLLDDSALAARIGAAGRDLARREFDYRVHSRRLYEFLDGLAGPAHGPARQKRMGDTKHA